MKTLSLLFLVTLFLMPSCHTDTSNYNLYGNIEGVESDTILVYTSHPTTKKWISVDTVPLKNGNFETSIRDTSILLEIAIAGKRKYNEKGPQFLTNSFLFFPGDHMEIKGEIPFELVASGTELYDGLSRYGKYMETVKAINEVEKQIYAFTDEDTEKEDSLYGISDELTESLYDIKMEIIKENPHSRMAGYLVLDLPSDKGLEAIRLLDDSIKNGIMALNIAEAKDTYERDLEVQQAGEKIKPGLPAPDFSLTRMDGKNVVLSDFRGKYTVLDFWGSWCGWCIAGMPRMKTYYEKYRAKVEFIGIGAMDTKEKWQQAVKQHQLPWVNVLDTPQTDVVKTYGISSFPTKILIDPEGIIVEMWEGEEESFYEKLDSLFR